ncbi:MAG: maleylpyruvate isomerase family mycothiol-dependent enzyme [Terracoccus sp.]
MTTPTTPTLCGLDELGDGLGRATTVLRANAGSAGLTTAVPTCPGWDVGDLVVHTGMVHRWAAANLAPPTPPDRRVDPEELERGGRDAADLLGWFDDGATALLQALADAPDDLEVPVFLHAAPPARLFWARRQCHETTVHAVDALAARLGRCPTPEETWIRPSLALDGIDELLRGFVPRARQHVNPSRPTLLIVAPDDGPLAWRLDLHPDRPPAVERVAVGSSASSDHVLRGSAVELYLRLWSRSPAEPVDEVEQWWRDAVAVRW